MELQNMDLRGGSLQISTEVLGKIARCAALEVAGVAEVSCGSQNRKVKDRLIADGVCSDQTIFVINHFSHNGNALYDELCEEVRKDGFLVAFDGRIVEL